MAAGLGFKDFTTGEVLTAADVDGYLMQGVWVFASAAARSAAVTSPQEGNYSFLKDTNSTEYYDGSAWVSAGGGGGGKVLQVIMGSTSTEVSSNSQSYSDTGLTATITPSLATSKVLVLVSQNGLYLSGNDQLSAARLKLVRTSTDIAQITTRASGDNNAIQRFGDTVSIAYLDTPATTSATTYKTTFSNHVASTEVRFQVDNSPLSTIILMEIGA